MVEDRKINISQEQLDQHTALYVRNTDDLAPYFAVVKKFYNHRGLDFFLSGTAHSGRVNKPVYTQGVIFGLSITHEALGEQSSEIAFDEPDFANGISSRNDLLANPLPSTETWDSLMVDPSPENKSLSDILVDLYECNPLIYYSIKDQMKIFGNDVLRKNFLAGISDSLLLFYRKIRANQAS
ncbi:MAG: hypothetical protein HZC02_02280 [Candidatus Levybacteria bacterium]|nr:hypothetical protein [Candidatus Levybacteria bacterium]